MQKNVAPSFEALISTFNLQEVLSMGWGGQVTKELWGQMSLKLCFSGHELMGRNPVFFVTFRWNLNLYFIFLQNLFLFQPFL